MEYDFTNVCEGQIEKLEKRLKSFKKNCLNDVSIGLGVVQHNSYNEVMIEVDQTIQTVIHRTLAIWTEGMRAVKAKI